MQCDTGDIFCLDKYDHIRTQTLKPRFAVVLVPKEITELVPSICPLCSNNCGLYTSPLEKTSSFLSILFKKIDYAAWLDQDRHCHITDSNLQQSCKQQPKKYDRISRKNANEFFDNLKMAYRSGNMVGSALNDPNFGTGSRLGCSRSFF
jgi:mRNA-degrading endonuclease toxin of MazEF toxin-antitoxin module